MLATLPTGKSGVCPAKLQSLVKLANDVRTSDMKNAIKYRGWCPICQENVSQSPLKREPGTRDVNRPHEYRSVWVDIVRCEACRAVFVHRSFPEEMLDRYYSCRAGGTYPTDMEAFGWWLQSTKGAILHILRHLRNEPRGPLLDIGCGRGTFLHLAKQQGWKVTGLELNAELADFVQRKLNIETIHGNLFKVDVPTNHYSVVTLFDVLEHLYDPVRALERCREILRPGGLVVVKSPSWRMQYFKEFLKRAFGVGSGDIAGIGHINQFAPSSIRTAFRKAGLNCVSVIPARTLLPAMRGASFSVKRTMDWCARELTNGIVDLVFKTTRMNLSFNLLAMARKPL